MNLAIPAELTNSFLEKNLEGRMPPARLKESICTSELTKDIVSRWRNLGCFVVANAGGYDILGLNHLRGLVQARLIGAACALGGTENPAEVYDLACSDKIKMLISLDTNEAIKDRKSRLESSGGSIRPILDWQTRATFLGMQTIGGRRYIADFITKHGPQACDSCEGESCWQSDPRYSVASMKPDLVIVKDHDPEIFDKYGEDIFHIIRESEGAYTDKILDDEISTSTTIRRIRNG